jgi:hypothetical protein
MDDKVQAAILSGVLSAIVTGVVTYFATVVKIRRELEASYDRDLREKRIEVYKDLWKHLEPLARYARPHPFSRAIAKDLTQTLRFWYFETGGLFLSERTRDAYFAVQEALKQICEDKTPGEDHLVSEEGFETIIKKGSTLRTQMTLDVGTRKRPLTDERQES